MGALSRSQLLGKKIGVLLGGFSTERDVSLKTGKAVLTALCTLGYQAEGVDVGHDLGEQLSKAGIEVAFVALHGRYGEDGCVQGLLELMEIPYTGSGVQASSVAMDKIMTKQLLIHHNIPTPAYQVVRRGSFDSHPPGADLSLPLVVKPAREGSTIGVSIARDMDALQHGLDEAGRYDDRILLEEYIAGDELTVGVVGDEALPLIKIVPNSGFYDYQSKYLPGNTSYLLDMPLTRSRYQRIQDMAVKACRILGCRGAARVDFMANEQDCYCIEVNTIPGMTQTSLLPKAAKAAGIEFEQLVEGILLDAGLNK